MFSYKEDEKKKETDVDVTNLNGNPVIKHSIGKVGIGTEESKCKRESLCAWELT